MKYRKEIKEKREKRAVCTKHALFSLFFILLFFKISAQDSIPQPKDLTEEKEIKFQEFFFKALSEKSIRNYQKAVANLEECNQLLQNNVAVFFEFSKNYLLLNKPLLAKEYINRALEKEPENIWMLSHLVEIHKEERDFKKAIKIQEQIVALDEQKKTELVFLYLKDNQYEKASNIINEIERDEGLTGNLIRIKESLKTIRKPKVKNSKVVKNLNALENSFKKDKSFTTLKLILELLEKEKKFTALEGYSSQGISLFPAQPLVYLANGKAQNKLQNFKKATLVLQTGIDFVIDNNMEIAFYKQLANAAKGLGKKEDEKKYKSLAKKLKS